MIEATGDYAVLAGIMAIVMGLIEVLKVSLSKIRSNGRNGNPGKPGCKYDAGVAAVTNERLETLIRSLESVREAVGTEGGKTRNALREELQRIRPQ